MIRIIVADDHQMVRQGLRSLLKAEPDMELLAEAEDGRAAVQLAAKLSPDVVVMDIDMPNVYGLDATRQLRAGEAAGGARNCGAKAGGPGVVALTGHSNRAFTREMLRAGAGGLVLKENAFSELVTAIRSVVADQVYLSPKLAAFVAQETDDRRTLTSREREVLQLLAAGRCVKEIAAELHVSCKTVDTHRHKLMVKLNFDSVAQLTKYAICEGMTPL
jgi:two-component system response regulator NreC